MGNNLSFKLIQKDIQVAISLLLDLQFMYKICKSSRYNIYLMILSEYII